MPELYEILRLRAEVFVVEQTCVYQDLDGADADALHLLGYHQDPPSSGDAQQEEKRGPLAAYARVFSPTADHVHARGKPESNIGRVLTHGDYRRFGYGKGLMQEAIRRCVQDHPTCPIRIGAYVM